MSETTANFIFDNAYSNPGYIVYLIESYQSIYGNLYTNRAAIYKSPYDTLILPYLDGSRTMASLNAVLPTQINMFIQDTVLDNYKADSVTQKHPLRRALKANNVYDWVPAVKVQMNYCEADEQVPYQNSLKTLDTMLALNAPDVTAISRGALLNHSGCVFPSLSAIQQVFLDLAESCLYLGVSKNIDETSFTIYPNPASVSVTLKQSFSNNSLTKNGYVTISGMDGRTLDQFPVQEEKKELNISNYPKGIYFVQLHLSNEHFIKKLIIQ